MEWVNTEYSWSHSGILIHDSDASSLKYRSSIDDADGVGGTMQANGEAPKCYVLPSTWPRVHPCVWTIS